MKIIPQWLCLAGFGSSVVWFGLFFGGSGRDAAWIWVLYILGFFGGLMCGFVEGIWWMSQTPVDLTSQNDHR